MNKDREPLPVSWPFDYVYALNGLLLTIHDSLSTSQAKIFGKPHMVYLTDVCLEYPRYTFVRTRDFITCSDLLCYTSEETSWIVRRGGTRRENVTVQKNHFEFRSDGVVFTSEVAKKRASSLLSYESPEAKRYYTMVYQNMWSYALRKVDEMILGHREKVDWDLCRKLTSYCLMELGEADSSEAQSPSSLRLTMGRVRSKFDMIRE